MDNKAAVPTFKTNRSDRQDFKSSSLFVCLFVWQSFWQTLKLVLSVLYKP